MEFSLNKVFRNFEIQSSESCFDNDSFLMSKLDCLQDIDLSPREETVISETSSIKEKEDEETQQEKLLKQKLIELC